mgnify:FL=1
MALSSRVLKNQVITSIFSALLVCSSAVIATDDAYLKMLEGEAEDLQLDQSGQLEESTTDEGTTTEGIVKKDWKWEGDLEGDVLPPGLAQDEFATVLKNNFYGSFVFYRKLNSNDQNTVYYRYTKASPAHLDAIRKDILDHLKK